MSKFRPSPECIYVIPDIHGYNDCLEQILNRILPLRPKDSLIFLGDYVDRGPESHKVVQRLTELKDKYPDQVTFIMGNHEWLLLAAIDAIPSPPKNLREPTPQHVWLSNGGIDTIRGYCMDVGIDDWQGVPLYDLQNIIPKHHIDFLINDTCKVYETEDYIFCHAGCDPDSPLDYQDDNIFLWDRSLYRTALNCIHYGYEIPWSKTVVTGHNYEGPIITDKYMMLDCSGKKKLLVVDLNSMDGFYAQQGKKRMVSANLQETKTISTYMKKYL